MARGGYRPGAGRPTGTKRKAKPVAQPTVPPDIVSAAAKADLTPLDYMLKVMRSSDVDDVRRDRMAIAAAPFCHHRVADNRTGKKDEKEAAAKTAGQGSAWGDDLAFSNERPN